MKIILEPEIYNKLMAYAAFTQREFSGVGFVKRDQQNNIIVYDIVLLDVGNEGYTEIPPEKMLPLLDREDVANMKLWFHRHPITGWSNTDLQTILKEPLGSSPELLGWWVSIVLTPEGWIGRIDNKSGKSKDLEVVPSAKDYYKEIADLFAEKRTVFFRAKKAEDDGCQGIYEPNDDEFYYSIEEVLEYLRDIYDPAVTTLEEILRDYCI